MIDLRVAVIFGNNSAKSTLISLSFMSLEIQTARSILSLLTAQYATGAAYSGGKGCIGGHRRNGNAPTAESITAHAHQLNEDARALQEAIQNRQKNNNVPGSKLLPFCKSVEALVKRFLAQTGVQAWETHLNEISHAQQQQAKQIEELTKAVTIAAITAQNNTTASGSSGLKAVRSWAKVASGEAEPPPATRTIRSWVSASGSSYQDVISDLSIRDRYRHRCDMYPTVSGGARLHPVKLVSQVEAGTNMIIRFDPDLLPYDNTSLQNFQRTIRCGLEQNPSQNRIGVTTTIVS
ncbi:hypothetical protein BKA67DRAFT_541777 [Truncatella angustata]|uniref:Uncharacterized protein n=1 Tax=Truncatella angustata TaxID=152316 RepID=A0A9P8U8U6_9PEZI|nr:uncharacterized protein BKA67DRAFT_541777 [Truncatella angustata]KAH6645574.1 hypothetical protein BKA67DRAFT_541777 [Truncatella angustata]